jgi:uncharacterized protein
VRLFAELGVASQPTVMSFAVRNERTGLEYNATDLDRLFVQRRGLAVEARDVPDHAQEGGARQVAALLELEGEGPTLGEYLDRHGYGRLFRDDHLIPMASALWSSPSAQIERFPAKYLVRFMANHRMLSLGTRPPWRVVQGGSASYVRALQKHWQGRVQLRLAAPVERVTRREDGALLQWRGHQEHFDAVVLACHADQALALLADPSEAEREVLGAIRFQRNDTVLHTDVSVLPRDPRAWAAWNALIPRQPSADCTVSYCMNQLQSLQAPETFVVSLNCTGRIDPARILKRLDYAHPVYSHAMVQAQARRAEISGVRHTWYCGAWWGFGFHEDGLRSAVEVARGLDCPW